MLGLGLAIALVLNDRIRGGRHYQAIVFLPYVLPATAIGIAFSFLLQQNGVLNTALRDARLGVLAQDWLGNSHLAIVSVGGTRRSGSSSASASSCSRPPCSHFRPRPSEAARIDGAGWWSLQLRVLVPQIRPIIELLAVIQVITVLSWVFNYVYVLTAGGPGYASSVMELLHLAELLERRQRHRGDRRRDAARHGQRADRPLAVGASGESRPREVNDAADASWECSRATPSSSSSASRRSTRSGSSCRRRSRATPPTSSTRPASRRTRRSLRCAPSFDDQPMPRWMWNSFLVTVSSVGVSTLVALLAAYGAVFGRFRGHRLFLSTSVALMVVPPVTLLVPMFVFMVDTGWVNHLQSVIVFYTGLLVPFAVFFLAGFFRTIPQELIEAASSEGAGPFTVLRRVVMPLSGAASFTLVVVQAIWVWNELLIALVFLQDEKARAR